jgi:hypothetical protein
MPPATRHPPARPAHPRRARGAALAVLIAAVAAVAGGAYLLFGRDDGPSARDAADAFAASWSRGDDRGAAQATTRPVVAAKALTANRRGLDGAKLRATVTDVTKAGDDDARARLRLAWKVPQFGRFAYTTRAALHRDGDAGWQVVWDPRLVHPALTAATRLGTSVDRPARAPILDRAGRPLVTARAVVRVGVARDRVKDVDATAAAVAKVVDIDAAAYAKAIRNAGPRQFVEAVELRAGDFAPKRAALEAIGSARPTARPRRSGSSASRRATRSSSRARRPARSSSASPTARRTAPSAAGRARRAARCARRSTATSRPRPRRRSATATAPPRSSRSDPRRAMCSRSPTARPTPRSTARSAGAIRPARRSRSSARPRCCATA